MSLSKYRNSQVRVVVKFLSDNVPGEPIRRHLRLTDDFCSMVLGREFNKETDYIHIPGQFDMEHQQCWMVLDINVKKRGLETGQIPEYYFKANYGDDSSA
jgi:hypothetical protein